MQNDGTSEVGEVMVITAASQAQQDVQNINTLTHSVSEHRSRFPQRGAGCLPAAAIWTGAGVGAGTGGRRGNGRGGEERGAEEWSRGEAGNLTFGFQAGGGGLPV